MVDVEVEREDVRWGCGGEVGAVSSMFKVMCSSAEDAMGRIQSHNERSGRRGACADAEDDADEAR